MDWTDVGKAIGTWAPKLGALLAPVTGGTSAAIGGVIGIVAKACGLTEEEATPDKVMEVIKRDPEIAYKWMVAEKEHELAELQAVVHVLELEVESTKSAQAMQGKALDQDDIVAKRFVYYYAMFLTAFVAIYCTAVTFVPVPVANQRMADTILGFLLGTILATVIQFFFGTSMGSLAKNKMMAVKDQIIGQLKPGR